MTFWSCLVMASQDNTKETSDLLVASEILVVYCNLELTQALWHAFQPGS